jgi:hypothetical protein|tara:strand:+ start:4731 stop:4934 length:204 start_codon:yes stop_codon:yes gene_type:complete
MFINDIVGTDEDQEVKLPNTSKQLVKLLNEIYPESSPNISDEVKDMYFKAGQRDVVRFLNELIERDK